jgi:hypothetical protein
MVGFVIISAAGSFACISRFKSAVITFAMVTRVLVTFYHMHILTIVEQEGCRISFGLNL